MTTETEIIKHCTVNKKHFKQTLLEEKYQNRGIFNSEALLVVSITKALGVNHLIESGRARGYSTNIFAKFFKNDEDFKITSIDFDKKSKDAKYSEKYLKKYSNVNLVYGNANIELCKYLNEECVIFIDGPKGDEAILLAVKVLENKNVKAVFVHDLHKNTFHRNIFETVFNNTFFSDDEKFVETFQKLDENCWHVLKDLGEAPYIRKNKKIDSYASTIALVFNDTNTINQRILENYLAYYENLKSVSIKRFISSRFKQNSQILSLLSYFNKLITRT